MRQNESDWMNMFYASFHITSTITEKKSNDRCDYWSNGGHQHSDRALVTMSNGLCDRNLNLENDSHDDARASIRYHWAKLRLAETWYIHLCTSLKRFWGNAAYLCNLLYFDRNMPELLTWQGSKTVRIFYLKNERLIAIDSKKQKKKYQN